jgi:hypothetical protein
MQQMRCERSPLSICWYSASVIAPAQYARAVSLIASSRLPRALS